MYEIRLCFDGLVIVKKLQQMLEILLIARFFFNTLKMRNKNCTSYLLNSLNFISNELKYSSEATNIKIK